MFGIFKFIPQAPLNPIFRGFDDIFYAPHSRHTEIRKEDIIKIPGLEILAEGPEAGVHMIMGRGGREVYVTGHAEYSRYTLDDEYKRDIKKGLPIEIPKNYYLNNDPQNPPIVTWRGHGNLMFTNWLNYFVYQETPYDINAIR